MPPKLGFDAFCNRVLKVLEISWIGPYERTTDVFDELALDSLEAFELIVIIEALAGLVVPGPEVPPIFTLGDAHRYYEESWETAQSDPLGHLSSDG